MGANVSVTERFSSGSHSASATMVRYTQPILDNSLDRWSTSGRPREKKKKLSKFATLRKKLTRSKCHKYSPDHGKVIRELTSNWALREVDALVDEYQSSAALKELADLAEFARPHANTIVEDLLVLFQQKFCTDVDLVYEGVVFPAHRAILCIRCAFFRELLARYPGFGTQVPVSVHTPGVDVQLFSALLRYLYTGEFGLEERRVHSLKKLLSHLAIEFGAPNQLEDDLRTLLDTGAYYDTVLVFSSESEPRQIIPSTSACIHRLTEEDHINSLHGDIYGAIGEPQIGSARRNTCNEMRCHKAILAARSKFFHDLFLRRTQTGKDMKECALHTPSYVVLDESIITRRYAQVLLSAAYLDSIDFSCMLRSSISLGTLSEVQAMVSGRGHLVIIEEAMELYQIGRFVDFDKLAQGCEDIVISNCNADNLVTILQWGSQSHGSKWVRRQALHFLREEFLSIAQSNVLAEIPKEHLIEAISSDYLQCGEMDVLNAVVKWAELQLIKRIEEREPNLLSHTMHSISKKGVKKRHLSKVELHAILLDLISYVRFEHVIPNGNSEALATVIRCRLVVERPSFPCSGDSSRLMATGWVRTRNSSNFVKPRLFMPYFVEAKLILKERLSKGQQSESLVPHHVAHPYTKPITQYMLIDLERYYPNCVVPEPLQPLDVIYTTKTVPDKAILDAMKRREAELLRSPLAERAFSLPGMDRGCVVQQIRLRVVHEFGLSSSATSVWENPCEMSNLAKDTSLVYGACCSTPGQTYQLSSRPLHQPPQNCRWTTICEPTSRFSRNSSELTSGCYGSSIRNPMPDIAMESIDPYSFDEHDIALSDLDLGDGTNHCTGTMWARPCL